MGRTVRYSDGSTERADSVRSAIETIRRRFPGASFYLEGSWQVDEEDIETIETGQATGRILAWRSQADMDGPDGNGDDGSNAVAEILSEA